MLTTAAGLERGMCVIVDGRPYVAVDSRPVKYGKGPVFVHAELRDVLSGIPRKVRLRPAKQLEKRELVIRWTRYLQSDDSNHIFSDSATNELVTVPIEFIGNDARWLEEGGLWKLVYLDGEFFVAVPV